MKCFFSKDTKMKNAQIAFKYTGDSGALQYGFSNIIYVILYLFEHVKLLLIKATHLVGYQDESASPLYISATIAILYYYSIDCPGNNKKAPKCCWCTI